ncbi:MAG: pyridoxal kinase [Hyphomicrobiaceae bacterium]|nr:pyridoxal kinase [Hyphomicrobiaceae bacterium]
MARVLAISSFVAYGHVGLSAAVPTLTRMGHEVIAVPTVMLSSHYGHQHVSGFELDTTDLSGMLGALRKNGWLQDIDAVLTGFMPDPEVVAFIARELERIGEDQPETLYLCDPVLGDDPDGLYVREEVATAVRDKLMPLADILTPNRFELSWLTGLQVEDAESADAAAQETGAEIVMATSIPAGDGLVANVLSDESGCGLAAQPFRIGVPHGTGDLISALVLGHLLDGFDNAEAMARAAAGVRIVIEASLGSSELNLAEALGRAVAADPAPLSEI